jgi:proline iminopeptidase
VQNQQRKWTKSFFSEPEDSGYIPVNGGKIWYRINGRRHFARGKTPLLVLHGGPGSSHHYLLPLSDLARDRPVILYGQLDCGLSERPGKKENGAVDRFVSEIDSIREALGLSEISLFGNSCGATWVTDYATRNPGGLRATILGSPFLSGPRYKKDIMRLLKLLPEKIRATLEHHEAQGTTDSEAYHQAPAFWLKKHVCRSLPWPDYLLRTLELFNENLYHHMWGASESDISGTLKSYDLSEKLENITSPSPYLCGEHDEMTPDTTRYFASQTRNSVFRVIEDASHTTHIEKRKEFMALLGEFLNNNAD